MSEFDHLITQLHSDCACYSELDDVERRRAQHQARTLGTACVAADVNPTIRAHVLSQLADVAAQLRCEVDRCGIGDPLAGESLIAEVVTSAAARWRPEWSATATRLDAPSIAALERLYGELGSGSPERHQILRWLASDKGTAALQLFADLLTTDPPQSDEQIDWAVEPLFRHPPDDAAALFPRLLEGLAHPVVAAVVLDLSHHLLREGVVSVHPATDRADEMAALLGKIAERLTKLAEAEPGGPPDAESRRLTQQTIARSVALAAGISEALAWMGCRQHVGKLYQALDVPHRRVVIEAAASLARLDERAGIDTLVRAASDPAARSRALAYLEELDELHEVQAEHRSPEARAAGTLAAWLADPTQFGFPPTSVQPIEAVAQHWPGYEGMIDCFLLEYQYSSPSGELSGIGIVGPVTHATDMDLSDLPTSDAFAYFAGWHAQHDEITECAVERLTDEERHHLDELVQMLIEHGFEDPQPVKIGDFFGERVIVTTARRGGQPGTVIVTGSQMAEGTEPIWIAAGASRHPIDPDGAYHIYKGRQFLRIFNS
jgi:hypothetical protein